MARFETQVGIVGAGPAGLMLSHLLHLKGVHSIVLEARSRLYCEGRVRAGVLEHTSVHLLQEAGVGDRLEREGLRHEGIDLGLNGVRHRIPFVELTGKCVTVYGQQEVVKDLIARRLADGGDVRFECGEVSLEGIASERPRILINKDGQVDEIRWLRRVPRNLSRGVSGRRAEHLRAGVSFCVAGDLGRGGSIAGRAGLHAS
jgi:p-hydroxybenzoate 3-monooxygenase